MAQHVTLLALLALPALCQPAQLNAGRDSSSLHAKRMQIVGGTAADIKEFGHQVSWLRAGRHMCGGSIISPEWVLTAAHCCIDVNLGISEVVAGSTVIPAKGRGQTVKIVEVHAHPDFDPQSYYSDIALLRVSPPLKLDSTVRAITLIDPNKSPKNGDPVHVTGWGKLSEIALSGTTILQKVKVQMKDFETCRARYQEISMTLTDTTFCASADGKDACQGDSGGPLIFKDEHMDFLLGIVSSGKGCALKEFPGLYTDLRHDKMRAFISKITGIKL